MSDPLLPSAPLATVVGVIKTFLQGMVADLVPDALEPKLGWPHIVPAMALWGGLMVCVLRGS